MNLQLALDTCNIKEAIEIIKEVYEYIEIVEIGTPMIIDYGMEPVRRLAGQFGDKMILADTKIMDAGEYEAEKAFLAGAKIVTVMGITNDETIIGAVKAAKRYNGKILADMMCVQKLSERAKKLLEIGVDYICVHTAVDVQKTESPFESLAIVEEVVGSKYCAIAGGINEKSIIKVAKYNPEIVIVGNGITGQKDRRASAKNIHNILCEN